MYLGKARVVAGDPWTPAWALGAPSNPHRDPQLPTPRNLTCCEQKGGPREHSRREEGDREKMSRERAGEETETQSQNSEKRERQR